MAGEVPGQSSTHWSNAPVISPVPSTPPPAPVGGETEVCVACQGSGLLNSQVNLRLFRLIGTGQLRLAGPTAQVAPVTPAPAAPATPAPAAPATPAPAAANLVGLVTGPKSVQASVKTQVDLVLQLVQVFAV